MYQLFYEGTDVPKVAKARASTPEDAEWASSGKPAAYFHRLRKCLGKMSPKDRLTLMQMTRLMAARNERSERRAAKK